MPTDSVLGILGHKVTYCRMNGDGMVHRGVGYIHHIFISDDGRPQVRVHDGVLKFNIDLPAINATEEGEKRYFSHCAAVTAHAAKVNGEVRSLVANGNAEIEEINRAYMGAPIDTGPQANDNVKGEALPG